MASRDIGLVGLGVMGSALALNIAEKGFGVAVWNRDYDRTEEFMGEAGALAENVTPAETYADLVTAIEAPRAILMMVPAGKPVDEVIAALTPLLSPGDLLIDGGNANFHDTNRRVAETGAIDFLGVGVSGGEEGARHGPSMMAGGDRGTWARVAPIFTAIAAKHKGEACAAWLGPEGAGHFVKTVHNGIEYADMQMIAEVYGILRDGMGMAAPEMAPVFVGWNGGRLKSYLIEITAEVLAATDGATGGPVLEVIVDAAGQKGTGRWTAIEAQHLGAPVPVIDAAVTARNLSARREARGMGQAAFGAAPMPLDSLSQADLESALIAGKILCYDQGFGMLAAAGAQYDWQLDLPAIARVWREGCIIRSAMLDDMAHAFEEDVARDLMLAPVFAALLAEHHDGLRRVVAEASRHGLPVPALSAALSYFDAMRTARGTADMIQAQRDYFGRHGFVR
ncbi:MAG: NADP-dependent phosphogluconate dehydrogenase, partial [Pseudomonadota bacterium]